jgi:arylsulfatase A-like enzyme
MDNTVIVFTSDHGDMLNERGMVQKRGFCEWSARMDENYRRRLVIQPAAARNGTSWDPEPRFDLHKNDIDKYLP